MNKLIDNCETDKEYWFKSWNHANKKVIDLKNNWNELKEWLEEENKKTFIDIVSVSTYQKVLSKMQEIEKGNENDK